MMISVPSPEKVDEAMLSPGEFANEMILYQFTQVLLPAR